ncbi:MAG: FAD-dependent oxidoreductase [Mesotoga sp.]|uniref:FAD-dependent oxidoreductase n=1 Tax=Mesotoga sp. TaxID=2053577 RepID=UPI00260AA7B4|nr:FAD-dependent oxidoreductase [Mesotoga sp.]MDD4208300.1 FAD-dependent oxidoreductase [Mesotoga sp.]MDD5682924.1 FAD-dependent oxidoreductase [Mesotoga sp.]
MDLVYDVVVVGGGVAGVAAAIAASRIGARVLLLEKDMSFGGVLTSALVNPMMTFHSPARQVIGGIGQEIIDRLVSVQGSYGHIDDPIGFVKSITPFDPEKMKSSLIEMLVEEGVDFLFNSLVASVSREGDSISTITTESTGEKNRVNAQVFIDSTGGGNLSIRAGAYYNIGDGSPSSCQPMTLVMRIGGVNREEIVSYVNGNRDDFVINEHTDLSYLGIAGFFSFMNRIDDYEISFKRDRLLFFEIPYHPGQIFMNTTRYPGYANTSKELTKAQSIGNIDVWRFMNFLKKEIPGFENSFLIQTGCHIGVRETTHIVGDYVLKTNDLIDRRSFDDSIAVGSYPIDIHLPGSAELKTISIPYPGEYHIPMRSLIPKGLANVILAGRAISADHTAFSAVRTSPLATATGMAAGITAALAVKHRRLVRDVNIDLIRREIVEMGGIL